jgi:hypothetical protein
MGITVTVEAAAMHKPVAAEASAMRKPTAPEMAAAAT